MEALPSSTLHEVGRGGGRMCAGGVRPTGSPARRCRLWRQIAAAAGVQACVGAQGRGIGRRNFATTTTPPPPLPPTPAVTKPTRIIGVVYNASNNELVRTNTLVKNSVVEIDSTPFYSWYEKHYRVAVPKKDEDIGKVTPLPAGPLVVVKEGEKKGELELKEGKISHRVKSEIAKRQKDRVVDPKVLDQMRKGRVLAVITSRPGQSGRVDGSVLDMEGPALEFYLKKIESKKTKEK